MTTFALMFHAHVYTWSFAIFTGRYSFTTDTTALQSEHPGTATQLKFPPYHTKNHV